MTFKAVTAVLFALSSLAAMPAQAQDAIDDAQATIERESSAGNVVHYHELPAGGQVAAYRMTRQITGILSSRRCFTDFSAPTAKVVGTADPARHLSIAWNELSDVRVSGEMIYFRATWMTASETSAFMVEDASARSRFLEAIQTLVTRCQPGYREGSGLSKKSG